MQMKMGNVEIGEIIKPISAYIVEVTPELAQIWLGRNIANNRKLKTKSIAGYAMDMANRNWGLTPDAIAFDAEGNLFNGQNRLNAVIKSGTTIQAFCVFGFPMTPNDFMHLDGGAKRTFRDALKTGNVEDEDFLRGGDIAAAYIRIKHNMFVVTPDMRFDFISANREVVRWAYEIGRHGKGGPSSRGSAVARMPSNVMVAMIDAHLCNESEDALEKFANVYCNNDFNGVVNYEPRYAIELRDKNRRERNMHEVNVAKSSINAFARKLTKMYIRDNLYPARKLPLR